MQKDAAPRGLFPDHPFGLTVVVLTGMWEIFALFGMRTILVFYLIKDLHFAEAAALQIYSVSTAASFAVTLLGAICADRLIGVRRAVLLGALLMAVGHLLLVVPAILFPALVLVALGNGLFKPALVAEIDLLYAPADPRRDRAFLLYKAGCNAGAIFSPLVSGFVGEWFGWRWALALCGVGMCVSAAIFVAGRRHLGAPRARSREAAKPVAQRAPQRLLPLLLVFAATILFASVHGQQGGTIALWADQALDRDLWGFTIPAAWFQSVNPVVIVLATPLVNLLWARRATNGGSAELRRMATGAVILAASFALVAVSATAGSGVNALWLVASLVLLAIGELYFDATGQAFVVRLAPARAVTIFISIWFLIQAVGFAGSGWIATAWPILTPDLYFLFMALLALASAAVLAGTLLLQRRAR